VRASLANCGFGLGDNALFSGLDGEALALVLPTFRLATYPAGTQLYARGRIADRLLLVVRGSVAVVQRTGGVQTTIAVLGPGEFTGERALLNAPAVHPWTAICREETQIGCANGDAVLAALTAQPAIGVNVVRALQRRVRDATRAIDALIAGA
jgi:CRP-like cAMP-binding protein